MRLLTMSLMTLAGLFAAMLVFGTDDGLPEDRLGRTPAPRIALPAAPQNEPARPAPQPQPAPAAQPAPAPAAQPDPAPEPHPDSAPQPETPPATGNAPTTTPAPATTPAPITTPAPAATPQPAPEPNPAPPPALLFVTGTTVNMRAGPSTSFEVVARLPRGTAVADLGEAAPGWTRIRVIDTGARGFMASRFLSPDRP